MVPDLPRSEAARLEALSRYEILDTAPEEAFDDIARLAAHACRTPIALVGFVDATRHWFKAGIGVAEKEIPLEQSFILDAIRQPDELIVRDAADDERFAQKQLVIGATGVRFYASVPLMTTDGHVIGRLAVADHAPRDLDAEQLGALRALARQTVWVLELRRSANERGLINTELERRINEQTRAESELRHTNRTLQALIQTSPLAIITLDLKGNISLWNPAAERIFGWRAQEILGHPYPLIPKENTEALLTMRPRVINRDGFTEVETLRQCKDGSLINVSIATARLLGDEGHIIGVMFVVADITERKQAEAGLEERTEQLRALSAHLQSVREEERIHIAREIHDELGQALTGLKWDLTWLGKRLDKASEFHERETLSKKIAAMMGLIDGTIQTVRRIATELRPGVLDDLGLVAAIEWQAQDFQTRTGITCRYQLAEDGFELGTERSTAIFRIFQEIMTNIARHSNADMVEVSLKKTKAELVLEVRDNGGGITESDLSKTHSLGLLGMRERAKLIGGQVNFVGEKGEGTTVTARIPL